MYLDVHAINFNKRSAKRKSSIDEDNIFGILTGRGFDSCFSICMFVNLQRLSSWKISHRSEKHRMLCFLIHQKNTKKEKKTNFNKDGELDYRMNYSFFSLMKASSTNHNQTSSPISSLKLISINFYSCNVGLQMREVRRSKLKRPRTAECFNWSSCVCKKAKKCKARRWNEWKKNLWTSKMIEISKDVYLIGRVMLPIFPFN